MRRKCTDSLIYWKKNPGRKPLILQGLRQTGKTWLLMDFGNKQYEHTLYINLETDRSAADYLSVPHDPGSTAFSGNLCRKTTAPCLFPSDS